MHAVDRAARHRRGQRGVRRACRGAEAQLLPLLGEPNKVIARRLGIAEGTVKMYVKSILNKLNMHRRAQAALWYAAQQPVRPLPPADIWD